MGQEIDLLKLSMKSFTSQIKESESTFHQQGAIILKYSHAIE